MNEQSQSEKVVTTVYINRELKRQAKAKMKISQPKVKMSSFLEAKLQEFINGS